MVKRRAYTPIHTDFTPFVNVALLLIVFFMWAKMIQKLNLLELALATKSSCDDEYVIHDWRHTILTLYQVKNHQLIYTFSPPGQQPKLVITCLHECHFREFLDDLSKSSTDHLVIIIKPTNESTFADTVDLLDEIRIAKVRRYAFVYKLSASEQTLIDGC